MCLLHIKIDIVYVITRYLGNYFTHTNFSSFMSCILIILYFDIQYMVSYNNKLLLMSDINIWLEITKNYC